MQQGQVFVLKKRAVDGRPVWAYRYRTDGRVRDGTAGRLLFRGDAAEALERALEHLRRQKGVDSTTRNRRRSTSSAGCSPSRSVPLAAAAFRSFARKRSRPGG
jgi:hypothetical protein